MFYLLAYRQLGLVSSINHIKARAIVHLTNFFWLNLFDLDFLSKLGWNQVSEVYFAAGGYPISLGFGNIRY